jgi:cobalt-zinc-cadmium efflux system protein
MSRSRRLTVALVINLVIVVGQMVASWWANSIGLLSDAAHNLADVGAVALSLWAVHSATRSPTDRRSFGNHRVPILVAQANAAVLLVVTGLLAFEGVRRLFDTGEVHGESVFLVALVAMVGNLAAARALHGDDHEHDLNMRSARLHLLADAGTSFSAAVAGAVIALTDGWFWLDPAISLLIGALIGYRAVALLREANDVLLEAVPPHLDLADVTATMLQVEGVEAVHDLHAWGLSNDIAALSAHLVVDGASSLADAQRVAFDVKHHLLERHGIVHATIEVEGDVCHDVADDPCTIGMPVADPHAAHGHGPGHRH